MTSRYLPYSTRPGRLIAQFLSDVAIFFWTAIWLLVGTAVHDAIATIAEAGQQVESGANGIAGNLASAGHGAQHIPLVGDPVSKSLDSASKAALDLAGAGHSLNSTASWLAILLAMAVAAPPILAVAGPWLFLRLRFFRRKLTVTSLAATAAGQQLLALRALTNRPPRKLTAVSADPVGGWRHEDPATMRALAALELRAAGVRLRAE
ncbi:hypothetical protein [Mycobacterium sp. Marseille-P9652]|uniref:hypothetical protein n=1 Tax=Mycobacterium sp. Marseille-P9652 TaxID=2654950 RepID=UPI0012E86798|nr:hypothetical protein [Mycobacterium sp. Marseille-P9652]